MSVPAPTVVVLLAQFALTPVAVTATVTVTPENGRFEVVGTWQLANQTDNPVSRVRFELMEDVTFTVSSTVGRTDVEGRALIFRPPIKPGANHTVMFEVHGQPKPTGRRFINTEEILLDGGAGPFHPVFDGPAELRICVHAPIGWVVAVPLDPVTPTCGKNFGTQRTIIAARRHAAVLRDDRFTVIVTPANEKFARPLLKEVRTIVAAFEARFGPPVTRTIEVVEVSIDSAYSMNGVIVLPPHVAPSVAGDGKEIPYLAHEIGHQWFGSLANGDPALREGLSTYMGLEQARRIGMGEAYVGLLVERERGARRGQTIRTIDPSVPWPEYDAVAYARAALAWDRLAEGIGREKFDRLTLMYLDTFRGRYGTIEEYLAPLVHVAPAFDRERFIAEKIDADWNPETNRPRPKVRLVDTAAFRWGGVALLVIVFFVGWRIRRR